MQPLYATSATSPLASTPSPVKAYISLYNTGLHVLFVCIAGMLPESQVQPDAISSAENALLDGWLYKKDYTAAGTPV